MLCPYRSKSGFCRNRVLCITQNGLCNHIYDSNGQVKANWTNPIEEMYMDKFGTSEKVENDIQ